MGPSPAGSPPAKKQKTGHSTHVSPAPAFPPFNIQQLQALSNGQQFGTPLKPLSYNPNVAPIPMAGATNVQPKQEPTSVAAVTPIPVTPILPVTPIPPVTPVPTAAPSTLLISPLPAMPFRGPIPSASPPQPQPTSPQKRPITPPQIPLQPPIQIPQSNGARPPETAASTPVSAALKRGHRGKKRAHNG